MLLWAQQNGIEAPAKLVAFGDRMMERPAVRKAMTHKGLIEA
jgi:glutathione S-transferase